MSNEIQFACPMCHAACRLLQAERAVQHQKPNCSGFVKHQRANDMQEFLRLAMLQANGGAPLLGNAALDAAPDGEEIHTLRRTRERATRDLIEQLSEGVKKL